MMNCGLKPFATFLDRLNHSNQLPEVQSPFKASAVASFISFIFIFWLDSGQVSSLRLWWAELLAYAFVPMMLSFIILYRSSWRQEMKRVVRIPLLAMLSCAIFAGVFVGTGLAMVLLALVYSGCFDHPLAFHY